MTPVGWLPIWVPIVRDGAWLFWSRTSWVALAVSCLATTSAEGMNRSTRGCTSLSCEMSNTTPTFVLVLCRVSAYASHPHSLSHPRRPRSSPRPPGPECTATRIRVISVSSVPACTDTALHGGSVKYLPCREGIHRSLIRYGVHIKSRRARHRNLSTTAHRGCFRDTRFDSH